MGGIAAIVHWDGRPCSPGDISTIASASPYRSPDGASHWMRGAAGLGHQRFITTPEQAFDRQPLVDEQAEMAFVFDGRLDNRAPLAAKLSIADSSTMADATLAFEAFKRWGSAAATHLLGDFAFIAWEWRDRRLTAARDHMGVRHLHFCSLPAVLVCATDTAQVMACASVPRQPNAAIAADYLACDVQNGPETLFRGVSRVPPGHVLTATATRVRLDRYWSPEPTETLRYASDDQYAAHCRELLTAAVDARLRSDRPAAAMLSGGLDSSSVVTVAHRLLADRRPQPFSLIFPDHAEADEQHFIAAVARACAVEPVLVRPVPVTAAALAAQVRVWRETPAFPADAAARSLYEEMAARGHRVALTGAAGDFLFSGSVFQYADLIRSRELFTAAHRFVSSCRAGGMRAALLTFVRAGIWPLLPLAVRRTLRPVARRIAGVRDAPPWLRLPRQRADAPDKPRGGSYATEDVTRLLASGMQTYFIECGEWAAAQSAIELRHPFLDARLVQFALNIPDDQRRRGPYSKYVLRQALAGHLADDVKLRRTKAAFGYCVVEALDSLGGEAFFRNLAIASAGWVDGNGLARLFAGMRRSFAAGDGAYGKDIPALWMVAAVELWFRDAFARTEVTCSAMPRRRA